jgi:arginine N-succinyltransferase
MPRHPIYVPLLPADAKAVLGQVHENTRPALELLKSEGFSITDQVDIFEAGPVVSAERDRIRTVRESRRAVVAEIASQRLSGPAMHIHNPANHVSARGAVELVGSNSVRIEAGIAEALRIKAGEAVRFASQRGAEPEKGLP